MFNINFVIENFEKNIYFGDQAPKTNFSFVFEINKISQKLINVDFKIFAGIDNIRHLHHFLFYKHLKFPTIKKLEKFDLDL